MTPTVLPLPLATAGGLQSMDAATLNTQLQQGTVVLADVREPVEYRGEHIAGAVSVPLSSLNPAQLPAVAPNQILVLSCKTGNRSSEAARKLLAVGYETVIQLEGGLDAWKQAGLPTVVDRKAPISLMRQVQIVAGSLVVTGVVLGHFVNPAFLILSGFVGSGLVFAGVSNTCALAMLLAKLPYNRV
ncbi:MAG: rhodanese-like domain-containing protein [Prochlorothrix sp.]|nr:rhodanese-like domain-containing protein [Prochlorothrix sp.]